MRRAWIAAAFAAIALGHDAITTKLTWNREISRLVYVRCAGCHRPGGQAFSLLTYKDARPWAKAISEEVLERRMPPWGAVKGFGEFRNDQALTQEQIQLIAHWVDGGAPEGDPADLPPRPKTSRTPATPATHELVVNSDYTIDRAITLEGLLPKSIPPGASPQITASLPDGSIEPLLWLYAYQPRFSHAFVLRSFLLLPKGSIIRGVPAGSHIALLIAKP